MDISTFIHCPLKMNPNGYGDPLTFHLTPQAESEVPPQLLDVLPLNFGTDVYVPLRKNCNDVDDY